MKICVMQPYFVPYPGYYLLFKEVDYFVVMDDVQFNRRGFVHRNLFDVFGNKTWITLPLKKKPLNTLICDLEFDINSEASEHFKKKINFLQNSKNLDFIMQDLTKLHQTPLAYINNLNKKILKKLKLNNKMILSSSLENKKLKGEKKIIDICKELKASEYINLPSGKKLYNNKFFKKENIKLTFLKEYKGKKLSILNYFFENKNFII